MGQSQGMGVSCRPADCRPNQCEGVVQDCITDLVPKDAITREAKLLKATREGDLQAVTEQITLGADVNARQPLKLITLDRYHSGQPIKNCGLTPLMYAASDGCHKIVVALLQARARVNDTDERGVSALHLAAASGDFATFQALLMNEARANAVDEEGDTVLDYLPQEVLADSALLDKFKNSMPPGSIKEEDFAVACESKKSKGRRKF
mmetsp:Transcript_62512/g.116941  ORF Transcript_62512/g.116941 Transcript_62512/m.116941 type:complete len:207 (-) Transcript_62512:92-712(-)